MAYDVGDIIRITGSFTDLAGTLVDPSTVSLKLKNGGTLMTLAYPADIQRSSTGVYYYDLNVTLPGTWKWRWYSTGTGQAAEEGSFTVNRSAF